MKNYRQAKEFGNVTVYVNERYGDFDYEIKINWSAIGGVGLSRAYGFQANLRNAIDFAEEMEQELKKEGLSVES